MNTQFIASQAVEIEVPEQPIPIQHYLRQPQRLVHAIADPSLMQTLSSDCFRLRMRPLNFFELNLQPIVDLRVWSADGVVHLCSTGCEIRGIEYINQRFSLNLEGKLAPAEINGKTYLKGIAHLQVNVDVPFPLSLTPKPFLETTGNGLLKSVLLRIKQRLMHQLLVDYRAWASNTTVELNASPGLIPADRPVI